MGIWRIYRYGTEEASAWSSNGRRRTIVTTKMSNRADDLKGNVGHWHCYRHLPQNPTEISDLRESKDQRSVGSVPRDVSPTYWIH